MLETLSRSAPVDKIMAALERDGAVIVSSYTDSGWEVVP